jgi:hypothetical protein
MEHVSGPQERPVRTILKATGQWIADTSRGEADPVKNESTWGTKRHAGHADHGPHDGRSVRRRQGHGQERRRLDDDDVKEKETEAARAKQAAMKRSGRSWLWGRRARGQRLAAIYNEKMNRWVDRAYDGSHLTFPGMSPAIELLEHQKNGVWRGLQSRQVLYDHVVGAGKTFQMASLAMEMRRLGIARKPLLRSRIT